MLRNLSKIFLLSIITSLTSCQSYLEKIYVEKCPEAATIPIDKMTTESTCQGIPIPFAAFQLNVLPGKRLKLLNESPGGLEDIVKRLHPLTKLPLSMDIALYGKEHELEYFFQTLIYFDNPNATIYNSETITYTKSIYDIERDIKYRDNLGNSILHNFAKNIEDYREVVTYSYANRDDPKISIVRPISIRRKALREFYSKLSGLTQIKNQLGQTPMDVASIRKNPASAWELYHLLGDETFI